MHSTHRVVFVRKYKRTPVSPAKIPATTTRMSVTLVPLSQTFMILIYCLTLHVKVAVTANQPWKLILYENGKSCYQLSNVQSYSSRSIPGAVELWKIIVYESNYFSQLIDEADLKQEDIGILYGCCDGKNFFFMSLFKPFCFRLFASY